MPKESEEMKALVEKQAKEKEEREEAYKAQKEEREAANAQRMAEKKTAFDQKLQEKKAACEANRLKNRRENFEPYLEKKAEMRKALHKKADDKFEAFQAESDAFMKKEQDRIKRFEEMDKAPLPGRGNDNG